MRIICFAIVANGLIVNYICGRIRLFQDQKSNGVSAPMAGLEILGNFYCFLYIINY